MTADRARALVAQLDLVPHPEGGYYREIFRSSERVLTDRHGASRAALTVIHFLLTQGSYSAAHRVLADEAWHFVEGDPLELMWATGADAWQVVRLGALANGAVPAVVVPGFEFEDFALLRDDSSLCAVLVARHPALAGLL